VRIFFLQEGVDPGQDLSPAVDGLTHFVEIELAFAVYTGESVAIVEVELDWACFTAFDTS